MNEEEKKAIKIIEELLQSEEPICEYMLKHQEVEAMQKLLNIIETQKAELKKKDKMIDLMIDTILKNDDNYWYLFDANKKAVEEYFTRLVEGEKKDGRE